MNDNDIKITQSLLKSLFDYRNGDECGIVFYEKFINKKFDLFPPTESQNLGAWFEYQLTKSLPKNGQVPQPEKTQKGELTAPYKRMLPHIDNFKLFLSIYGIKILAAGVDEEVNGLKATFDIIAVSEKDIYDENNILRIKSGQKFIIDIKTTGLLDDKWNDYGWNLDTLNQKHKIILQPIHYKYITELKYGERFPFIFLLFSNTNEKDYRAIFFDITDEDIKYHKEFIIKSVKWLEYYLKNGFEPKPSLLRCSNCPLKAGCKHFMAVPKITYFQLNNPNN